MAFAIDLKDEKDHYFNLADETGEIISNMGNNTLTIVDLAPWGKSLSGYNGFTVLSEMIYSSASSLLDRQTHPVCQIRSRSCSNCS